MRWPPGFVKGSRVHCPDHIHATLCVPKDRNHERLVSGVRKTFVPGATREGSATKSELYADVKLLKLPSDADIRNAYLYLRKKKFYKPMGE